MASPLLAVAQLMARQHGLVTRSQLLETGATGRQVDRLVRSGELERVRRGVYLLAGVPRSWSQGLHAGVVAGGPGAVASHSSAARLWGFAYWPDAGFEITVPRGRAPRLEGIRVHSSSFLEATDIAERDGVPCTSFERSLCDSTTQLSWLQTARTLDDGLRRNLASLDRLRDCVLRLDSGPERRLTVIQGLLVERSSAFDPGGSASELRVMEVLREAQLPLPVQQHRVRIGGRTFFLDYAYPPAMAFIEYYGLGIHGSPSAVVYDSDRLTTLSAAGWRPLIFTDATSDAEIVAKTSALLNVLQADDMLNRLGA
jgi:hypothetical protein